MANLRVIKPILLGLALTQFAGFSQAPKFVQQNYAAPQSAQTTVSVPYPAAQAAGNANIVVVGWNDTFASIASVSDSAGNNYQLAVPAFQANGMSQAIYYAAGILQGGNTLSVRFNQPAAFVDLRITEYSGLSANSDLFAAGTSATGDSSSADSGPVSVSTTNDLIFGAGMTATAFTSPSAGFNLRVITSPNGDIVEDQVAGGPGLYHGLATVSSGAWLMQVAAFKAASPAGGPQLNSVLTGTNTILITWPVAQSGFTLQGNTQLGTTNWTNVTNAVGVAAGQYQVIVPLSGPDAFFRLTSP
jgi:hypothetical protein